MTLYLLNLTDKTLFVTLKQSKQAVELRVPPNAPTSLPEGKDSFILSLVEGSLETTPEKTSLEAGKQSQYVLNPKKSFPLRWGPISMPEDCPWRIYRDQVTSLVHCCRSNAHERMP
jgi:hypothetical protein